MKVTEILTHSQQGNNLPGPSQPGQVLGDRVPSDLKPRIITGCEFCMQDSCSGFCIFCLRITARIRDTGKIHDSFEQLFILLSFCLV